MHILVQINVHGANAAVTYVETQQVKAGVECDIYEFRNDSSKDLAVVTVKKGSTTPLQEVISGDETIERYVRGQGKLVITDSDGTVRNYHYPGSVDEITVTIGQRMQWFADEELVFHEICTPPYRDGRFKDLD